MTDIRRLAIRPYSMQLGFAHAYLRVMNDDAAPYKIACHDLKENTHVTIYSHVKSIH